MTCAICHRAICRHTDAEYAGTRTRTETPATLTSGILPYGRNPDGEGSQEIALASFWGGEAA